LAKRIGKSEVSDRHTSATHEKKTLERYVYGTVVDGVKLGDMHVKDVRPTHVRQLVEKLEAPQPEGRHAVAAHHLQCPRPRRLRGHAAEQSRIFQVILWGVQDSDL
jgi:hypothetical protein